MKMILLPKNLLQLLKSVLPKNPLLSQKKQLRLLKDGKPKNLLKLQEGFLRHQKDIFLVANMNLL